ncbi:MAG: hypothetical protein M0P49_07820 [Bacilli bacterium]|nr:hypothetical protein [Bacilli bacterium]
MNKRILFITKTALFLAILLVVQFFSKPLGQYVTGSLVNLVLIISCCALGIYGGMILAIVSPFLAFFLGIGPVFLIIIPFIALGNLVISLIGGTYLKRIYDQKKGALKVGFNHLMFFVVSPLFKALVIYVGVVMIAIPLIPSLNETQVKVLSAAFSYSQLITALIGTILSFIIYPFLRKVIKD